MHLLCKKKKNQNKQTKENFMTRDDDETVLWIFFVCIYLFYKNRDHAVLLCRLFSHLTVELKSFPCHSESAYDIIWVPAHYDYHGYTVMMGIVTYFI